VEWHGAYFPAIGQRVTEADANELATAFERALPDIPDDDGSQQRDSSADETAWTALSKPTEGENRLRFLGAEGRADCGNSSSTAERGTGFQFGDELSVMRDGEDVNAQSGRSRISVSDCSQGRHREASNRSGIRKMREAILPLCLRSRPAPWTVPLP
jgi:hypothetical protein